MTDPIRALLRELLDFAVLCDGLLKGEGLWDNDDECDDGLLDRVRAALAAEPPAPAEPDTDAVLALAAIIRRVDGSHSLGAAALAEAILAHPDTASVFQPPAPAPADHVPDAGDMVAADGEREELAQWLDHKGRGAWPCPDGFSAEAEAEEYEMFSGLTRAAALLRQQSIEGVLTMTEHEALLRWGLIPVVYDAGGGVRIKRIIAEDGDWSVRNSRHINPVAGFPTAAAAWAALQQARQQEVSDERA